MQGIRYTMVDKEGKVVIKKCDNGVHASQRHFHEEVSFALVTSGASMVEIQGRCSEITGQTLVLIPRYAAHRCLPRDYGCWKFHMLYCDAAWLEGVFGGERRPVKACRLRPGAQACAAVADLFADLERGPFDLGLESRLAHWISLLLPRQAVVEAAEPDDPARLETARRYMEDNFAQEISLEDLSRAAGLSKYHLVRRFKLHYGLSPHQYLTARRINHAKTLLDGSAPMADIALRSGFYDQSHFSKWFKACTGITPGQYLRR